MLQLIASALDHHFPFYSPNAGCLLKENAPKANFSLPESIPKETMHILHFPQQILAIHE